MEQLEHPEQHGQDLTTGNIRRQLWSLAWPIMLSIFFYTLYNIVDTIWVGRISPEAIAAVSISQIALFAMVSLGMGITVGSGVVMSMKIGAKNQDGAEQVLAQSFVLSALIGVVFTFFSLIFADQILTASGATGGVYGLAKDYFLVVAGGSVLMFLLMTVVFAFNAQGDSFTPTKLFAVSTLLNVILDPILIFGWWIFPEMGIVGAGVATLISQVVFIVMALMILSSEKQMIRFRFSKLGLEWESVKAVFKIGFPASLTQVMQPLGLSALMFITAQKFAELGTVAFSIAFRLEFFAYLPAIGFGFSSMAIIGQCIGAKNVSRANETFKLALLYGSVTAFVMGVLGMIFAKPIISILTFDPVVARDVQWYLYLTGATYVFLACSLVVTNALQAVGHSWSGLWLVLLRYGIVTIPLTLYLTTQMTSMNAVWLALGIGNIVTAVVGFIWVKRLFRRL